MKTLPAWMQALPMGGVFLVFFVMPLLLVGAVSFWPQNEYTLEPGFTLDNYVSLFEGCFGGGESGELCTTFKTYLSTLKFCGLVWLITLVIGFTLAYFVAFHVPSVGAQTVIFTVMTIPFWTSNVIRMISWLPMLGQHGVVNSALMAVGVVDEPLRFLLFSDFAVVLAYVHLFTIFMIVPIFNAMSRIDRSLFEAALDAGAGRLKTLLLVVLPLTKSGIALGSIFVVTLVMGDFYVVKVMSGGGSASVVSAMYDDVSTLLFPHAAASAVLLMIVLTVLVALFTRFIDVRQELVSQK